MPAIAQIWWTQETSTESNLNVSTRSGLQTEGDHGLRLHNICSGRLV